MRKRKHIKDPLLGFGWVGYVSGVILIALVAAMVAGVELRYELLKLIVSTLGVDAMMYFVVRIGFLGLSIFEPSVSVVTGAVILVAFQVSPYRIRPIFQLVVFSFCTVWFLVPLEIYIALVQSFSSWMLFNVQTMDVIGVAVVGVVVIRISRSKLVAAMWGTAVVLALVNSMWIVKTGEYLPGTLLLFYGFEYCEYTSLSLLFDLLTVGSLLVWAVLERRKVLPEHMCESCGYDLAGLEDVTACPECGESGHPPSNASIN